MRHLYCAYDYSPPSQDTRRLADALLAAPPGAGEVYFHHDLVKLPVVSLRYELRRRLLGLSLTEHPDWWGVERAERIRAELEARRAT